MFITDVNGRLVLVNGQSKKIVIPDIVISHLLNYGDTCYFVSDGSLYKYGSNNRLLHGNIISLHQTRCSSRMIIVTCEDEVVILSPRVRLPNLGRVEYYCPKFTIYRTENNYISVTKKSTNILFPSIFNVRFINGVTPVGNIDLHVFMISNGMLIHNIYNTNGTKVNLEWESSTPIDADNVDYYYVNYRSSYHIISDRMLYSFMESGEREQHELDKYKIIDCCVVDYKKPIKLHNLMI